MAVDDESKTHLAIVGAGIVGLATARELVRRHPRLRVAVLERDAEVGRGQTGHNSGVIHAGLYYAPGSLKARLCVAGARKLYDYCDERGIQAERTGKVVVATTADELPRLDELERRGRENGVPGLRRLDPRGLEALEPHVRGVAGLHSPATGIVDYGRVARALAEDVRAAGGSVLTGCEVRTAVRAGRGLRLGLAGGGKLRVRAAVFCAGSGADRLARSAGAHADPRIVPFRGAYASLRPERRDLVRSMVYPVPDPALPFLGVHLTRHPDGEVVIGPTALLSAGRDVDTGAVAALQDALSTAAWPGTWRMGRRWWRTGIGEIGRALSRRALAAQAAQLVPGITAGDLLPAFAGIRAQALGRDGALLDDFVVSETERAVHVRNAPSPAATSALALARLVADRVDSALGISR